MFKKLHSFVVYEGTLVDVLKIFDTLGVKVYTIKNLHPQYENRWYISINVTEKDWKTVKKALFADSQIGGSCGDFQ